MQQLDTIGAILTAPGRSAVGIIRLSGEEAISIAQQVFEGKSDLFSANSHTIHYGWVKDKERRIDEALFLLMRGPKSYTGEDVVEIQCHGGSVAIGEIMRLLMEKGVRPAEHGEFTRRAFINGKLDFTRAEAIMDIVEARSDQALAQAVAQKSGVLETKIHELREALLTLIAYVQADLDYPEDDIERLDDDTLQARVEAILQTLEQFIQSAQRGRIYREGIKLVIAGRPNVGKSSLLNALLGRERAIVTDIAGTTRDVVTEQLTIRGIPVDILDTAGIRETADTVEAIGVERAKLAMEEADLVLYVVDASVGLTEEDSAFLQSIYQRPALLVVNKSDMKKALFQEIALPQVQISAKHHEGIEALEDAVYNIIMEKVDHHHQVVVNNTRHLALFEQSAALLHSFVEGLAFGMSKDILVIDLQGAWENLGMVTGAIASEDLLDTIFSRFCLGK